MQLHKVTYLLHNGQIVLKYYFEIYCYIFHVPTEHALNLLPNDIANCRKCTLLSMILL